jgi:hypothetical protein
MAACGLGDGLLDTGMAPGYRQRNLILYYGVIPWREGT